ncbi:hypothetical protein TNCV_1176661 [Trichonephila clavipes]|nr:hypothetical protein TNCV_1176661 [Trichonephila clavipes]
MTQTRFKKGKRCDDIPDIQRNVTRLSNSIPNEDFLQSFQDMYSRSQRCIVMGGNYFEEQRKRDLTTFERGITVGARNVATSIGKTAALAKCSIAAVINVCSKRITKKKTDSLLRFCGRHRVPNARIVIVQSNRRKTVSNCDGS